MKSKHSLSVTEKLLLAAYELEENGRRPFSAEDLVVSAWQKFPDAFGLAGYRNNDGSLAYPDSNRVFAEIMGSKPIRKRGFLKKVGTKMYQLTEAGREHARIFLREEGRRRIQKAGLPRDIGEELKRLFTSKPVEKFRNNRIEDITFYDACTFWGISPRSSAIELEGRIANLEKVVELAKQTVDETMATFDHGGHAFGAQDLELLIKIHQELLQRFSEEIKIIQRRTDERA
jgi:hypothetical protein